MVPAASSRLIFTSGRQRQPHDAVFLRLFPSERCLIPRLPRSRYRGCKRQRASRGNGRSRVAVYISPRTQRARPPELWVSDGTAGGTKQLRSARPTRRLHALLVGRTTDGQLNFLTSGQQRRHGPCGRSIPRAVNPWSGRRWPGGRSYMLPAAFVSDRNMIRASGHYL